MGKRYYQLLSIILLLLGLFFINIEVTIVGAVIGAPSLFSFDSVIGLVLILASGILFVAREGLEYRIKHHNPKAVKSFRRWLERKEHRKIPNETAEQLYKKFEQKYWKSVGLGFIQQSDEHRPLEYIEDFIEDFKKPKETYEDLLYRTKAKEILNEAGQDLLERKVYLRTPELVRLAKRCGYDTREKRKEGTLVKKEDNAILTVIPNAPRILRETARGIMKALATGKSSFRQWGS